MKNSHTAIQSLIDEWNSFIEHIKQHKPTEINLTQFGFADTNLETLPLPFQAWIDATKGEDKEVDIAFEKKLCAIATSIKNQITSAKNNGVNWLLNDQNFLNDCTELTQICLITIPLIRGYGKEQIDLDIKGALAARTEIQQLQTQIQSQAKDANTKSDDIATYADQVATVKANLEAAQNALEIAEKKLAKATADLNKQGLADAFAVAAKKFERQRLIFAAGFLFAIAGLLCVALNGKEAFSDLTNYEFIGSFAIAAPLIWLGWLCARQLAQTTKIQQDYEYKKATALTFEAHKNEIKDGDAEDKRLSEKFLNTVVQNFGDNPVRLLQSTKEEHGHPMEEALSSLTDKKIIEPLTKLSDLFRRSH